MLVICCSESLQHEWRMAVVVVVMLTDTRRMKK